MIRRAYDEAAKDPNFEATDDCTVVLRYTPDVPIGIVAGDDRNMKVTEPIDVYIADRLFRLTSSNLPAPRTDEEYRAEFSGRTMVVFGGSYGIGLDIAELARSYGCSVYSFSRSGSRTHVEHRGDVAAACRQGLEADGRIDFVVNTAGVLARGTLRRDVRGDDLLGDRDQLPRGGADRAGGSTRTWPRTTDRCCCSARRRTRAGAVATRCTPSQRLQR